MLETQFLLVTDADTCFSLFSTSYLHYSYSVHCELSIQAHVTSKGDIKKTFLIICTIQINILLWAKYISQRYHSTIPCTSSHWMTCFPILLQYIEFSKLENLIIFIPFLFWVFHNYIVSPFLFFTPNPFIFCSSLSIIFMSF